MIGSIPINGGKIQSKDMLPPQSEYMVICMFCGKILKRGRKSGISHGLCGACLDREYPEDDNSGTSNQEKTYD